MQKTLQKIYKKDKELSSLIEELENKLKGKVDFEFFIFKQTEGWALADWETHNILLSVVIAVIEEKGKFTQDDLLENSYL